MIAVAFIFICSLGLFIIMLALSLYAVYWSKKHNLNPYKDYTKEEFWKVYK